ncbi:hypothetical protein [Geobacter sp. AOG2]|nr:hypothetical protein [Geobacter sp. AOG2]GFE61809.1 hypothetical protein AOG2_23970 [Geobacter sp. AOG2]
MSIIGIIVMWVFLVIAFIIVTSWPMGKESNKRTAYWARFEGK